MRIVPLIVTVLIVARIVSSADEIHVRAGQSSAAINSQNKGAQQMKKGDLEGARRSFDEAIRLEPTLWPAYYNRAEVDFAQHKWEQAVQDADVALRNRSTFSLSALIRGGANEHLGRYAAALRDYDTLISFGAGDRSYVDALNGAAWIRATCPDASLRNGALALRRARTACGATAWKRADIIDTLAAAYAETGDFTLAIQTQERAIAVEQSSAKPSSELMEHLQKHLALFKQHKPVRISPEK